MQKQNKYASFGNYSHGMRHTRFYEVWKGMKSRCNNSNHKWYKNYGGKGIKVCERWLEFVGFYDDMYKSYLAHQASHSGDTTLDRIDSNKDYSKENCRWATRREQANNFSKNILVEYKGKKKTVPEWAREMGLKPSTLYSRLFILKMDLDRAFTKKI